MLKGLGSRLGHGFDLLSVRDSLIDWFGSI